MFEKVTLRAPELYVAPAHTRGRDLSHGLTAVFVCVRRPVVPKSYDDAYMRPPNTRIGERPCVCGDSCICTFLAKLRYGPDTSCAFIGTEFLLPTERERFLNGAGLPERRKKCLLCMRYFQHYNYLSARTNPDFVVGGVVQLQAFENAVFGAVERPPNSGSGTGGSATAAARQVDGDLPTHTSPVSSADGYLPSAMLFVDEEWMNTRHAREQRIGALMWKPVVKFSSLHYRYRTGDDGPYIVQVGVGADRVRQEDSNFRVPPMAKAASSGANRQATP